MSPAYNVYGYRFMLEGDAPEALAALAADFAFFAEPDDGQAPATHIRICNASPDYAALPPLRATVYTPRNLSYKDADVTVIDYHGRGLARHHRPSGDFELTTRDPNLQYEACYLFLLSQLGEALDRRGLHRVHALGISLRGRAILVLLPMGGGKSTLCAELLADPEVRLLSDDSPLIDTDGNVHAFPTRIGLLPGAEAKIPPQYRRTIERMTFGPKTLVDYRYFADRVDAEARPGFVCLGSRTLASHGTLRPASRSAACRRFVHDCVVGMGLFQGLEFFFQKSTREILSRAPIVRSRAQASWAIIKRSELLELELGRDLAGNARLVLDHVRGRLG
jgi:hypothetical protein